MIADYEFYLSVYMSDVLNYDEFVKYGIRADAYLEQATMGRYDDPELPESVVNAVKMAECAITEQCATAGKQSIALADSTGVLASESVGAHSVSYRSGAEIRQAADAEIKAIITRYLGMTGLLYRGIPCILRTR